MMRKMRCIVGLGALLLLLTASWSPGALAQDDGQDGPSADNFVDPPGAKTVPLGSLGQVEKHGNGPVHMILIPRMFFPGSVWKEFMERNADKYTMWAITAPGEAGTLPPPMPPSVDFRHTYWLDALQDGIVRLMVDEGIEQAVVVGHGMRAYVAMRLALDHPDKVAAVMVMDAAPTPRFPDGSVPPSKEERIGALQQQWVPFFRTVDQETWDSPWKSRPLTGVFCQDEERNQELVEMLLTREVDTSVRYFAEYLGTDLAPELPELEPPLLVLQPFRPYERVIAFMARSRAEEFGGDMEAARKAVEESLVERFGSLEKAKEEVGKDERWENLRGKVEPLSVVYVEGTGSFVMEDKPELVDREVAKLVEGLASDS